MDVKVFEATDMASGLNMVRKELGPDALIISTRTLKSGKLGVLGKSVFEITAASESPQSPSHVSKNSSLPTGHLQYRKNSITSNVDETDMLSMLNTKEAPSTPLSTVPNETLRKTESVSSHVPPVQETLKKEIDDLKELVQNLAGEVNRCGEKIEVKTSTPSFSAADTNIALHNLFKNEKATRDPITQSLLSHGINLKNAYTLTGMIKEEIENTPSSSYSMENCTRKVLQELIKTSDTLFDTPRKQKRIAFIGPTGVGKTTTLAKIAAQYLTSVSTSIALITIDTYRIAAVEQLKVYGELMDIPVDVVISPRQLDQALFKHRDKDLILIDTAGRSPRDEYAFEELSTYFLPDFQIQNHLVLSATTREEELSEIYRQFSKLSISDLILTKTDECSQLGVIINFQLEHNLPLSFVTNGQRVPEDLIVAESQKLGELIIPVSEGILYD